MNPIEELRYLVKAVDKEGELSYSKLLKPFNITPSQNEILKILAIKDGLSISQIGELLICGSESPSRLVDRLVKKNLVEKKKNIDDTRINNIFISDEGRILLNKTLLIEEDFNSQIESHLKNKIKVDDLIDILEAQVKDTRTLKQINLKKNF
ncbi:MarR family winged helix-turn-helix transcriptional regulator [Enterococcus alishanensis]